MLCYAHLANFPSKLHNGNGFEFKKCMSKTQAQKTHIYYTVNIPSLFLFRFQMEFSKFVSSEIRKRGAAEERAVCVSRWIAIFNIINDRYNLIIGSYLRLLGQEVAIAKL